MIFRGVAKLREYAELHPDDRISSGIKDFDALTEGGLFKGGISEFCGALGSGKRSLILSILAEFTNRHGLCAVIDASDSFDPVSAEKFGIQLEKILWIRCSGDFEKAITSGDYLVQSGLFSLIWLDLGLCDEKFLRMLPGSYWYRYKVALKETQAAMVVSLAQSQLRSAARQSISVRRARVSWKGDSCFRIFDKWEVEISMLRPFLRKGNISLEALWW